MFYQTYTMGSDGTSDSLLEIFASRLGQYTTNSQSVATDFEPEWMLVVTWYQATPYFGRSNDDEVSLMVNDGELHCCKWVVTITQQCALLDHVSKIVSILLSKLSQLSQSDTLSCYYNYPFLTV